MRLYLNVGIIIFSSYFVICDADSQSWPKLFERRQQLFSIDGSWSSWQAWSPSCYNNTADSQNFYLPWENFIIQSRNRTCSSPKPLYGGKDCKPPSHRFRQCSCMNPLGMSNNRIKDSQISSSKYSNNFPPSQARLGRNHSGWCAKFELSYFRKTYIQVDFNQFATVGAIETYGMKNGRISRYKLSYSLNGRIWKKIYSSKDKTSTIFQGNLMRWEKKKNLFHSHKVMKYLRLTPIETYNLPCLKMEVYGCIFTCGKLLTNSFGEIVARSSEEIDQNCLWRIEVLNTTALTFDFNVFYVMCEYGYLDFHDGNFPFSDAPLLKRICLAHEDDEIPILKLNYNSVWLNFVSNSSSSEIGFNIKYSSECVQKILLIEGVPVQIKSPNFPRNYFDNLNCLWTILPPKLINKIEINVKEFSVESSSNSRNLCIDDFVVFESEHDGVKQNLGAFCNNNKPPQHQTIVNAEKLLISFRSDSISSKMGFSFNLVSGVTTVLPATVQNKQTTAIRYSTKLLVPTKVINVSEDNNGTNVGQKKVKKGSDDDTWTIIIICAFSVFVLVLLVVVAGMNIRRFVNNRNEVNAHCAKAAAEQKQKKKHHIDKVNKEYFESKQLLAKQTSPTKVRYISTECDSELPNNDNSNKNTSNKMEDDGSTEVSVNNIDSVDLHQGDSVEVQHPDEVDGTGECSSYDSSSPQVHSPLRTYIVNTDSIDDAEESCV